MDQSWKRTVGQKIRHLSSEQAKAIIHAINAKNNAQGATIFHDEIKALTGGYNSQTINAYVVRKLAIKAGLASK